LNNKQEELLFEIRNELQSIVNAINILRQAMHKRNQIQETNLCDIYLSNIKALIIKINKYLEGRGHG
jgi:hypothetical protein